MASHISDNSCTNANRCDGDDKAWIAGTKIYIMLFFVDQRRGMCYMVVMMFRWQNKSWLVIKCFMICSWSFDIYIHHLFSFLHVMPKYIYDTRSNVNLFHQWEAISSIRNSCVLENKWWFDMIKLRLMNKYIFIHDLCTPCMYHQYIVLYWNTG